MLDTSDREAEIIGLVQRYYEIADDLNAAAASGCHVLPVNPFAATNREEKDLRLRAVGA